MAEVETTAPRTATATVRPLSEPRLPYRADLLAEQVLPLRINGKELKLETPEDWGRELVRIWSSLLGTYSQAQERTQRRQWSRYRRQHLMELAGAETWSTFEWNVRQTDTSRRRGQPRWTATTRVFDPAHDEETDLAGLRAVRLSGGGDEPSRRLHVSRCTFVVNVAAPRAAPSAATAVAGGAPLLLTNAPHQEQTEVSVFAQQHQQLEQEQEQEQVAEKRASAKPRGYYLQNAVDFVGDFRENMPNKYPLLHRAYKGVVPPTVDTAIGFVTNRFSTKAKTKKAAPTPAPTTVVTVKDVEKPKAEKPEVEEPKKHGVDDDAGGPPENWTPERELAEIQHRDLLEQQQRKRPHRVAFAPSSPPRIEAEAETEPESEDLATGVDLEGEEDEDEDEDEETEDEQQDEDDDDDDDEDEDAVYVRKYIYMVFVVSDIEQGAVAAWSVDPAPDDVRAAASAFLSRSYVHTLFGGGGEEATGEVGRTPTFAFADFSFLSAQYARVLAHDLRRLPFAAISVLDASISARVMQYLHFGARGSVRALAARLAPAAPVAGFSRQQLLTEVLRLETRVDILQFVLFLWRRFQQADENEELEEEDEEDVEERRAERAAAESAQTARARAALAAPMAALRRFVEHELFALVGADNGFVLGPQMKMLLVRVVVVPASRDDPETKELIVPSQTDPGRRYAAALLDPPESKVRTHLVFLSSLQKLLLQVYQSMAARRLRTRAVVGVPVIFLRDEDGDARTLAAIAEAARISMSAFLETAAIRGAWLLCLPPPSSSSSSTWRFVFAGVPETLVDVLKDAERGLRSAAALGFPFEFLYVGTRTRADFRDAPRTGVQCMMDLLHLRLE